MEQIITVKENGDFLGECPKCGEWKKLEFAHHDYGSDNFSRSTGMYLCHICNMKEKSVNPEKTPKERQRVAMRDYGRTNMIRLGILLGKGRSIHWEYNKKTGNAILRETIHRTLWIENIGTDYPEILYVQDGEIEE